MRHSFGGSPSEAAKEVLDRRRKVSGVRQPGSGRRASASLQVFRLELPDEPAAETGPQPEADAAD